MVAVGPEFLEIFGNVFHRHHIYSGFGVCHIFHVCHIFIIFITDYIHHNCIVYDNVFLMFVTLFLFRKFAMLFILLSQIILGCLWNLSCLWCDIHCIFHACHICIFHNICKVYLIFCISTVCDMCGGYHVCNISHIYYFLGVRFFIFETCDVWDISHIFV